MTKYHGAGKALFGIALVAGLWAGGISGAVAVDDPVNPADTLITAGNVPSCPSGFTCAAGALTFVHDITDDGFDIGLVTVTGATVTIHLGELVTTGPNNETFRFDLGPETFSCLAGNCVVNGGLTSNVPLGSAALADLNADGQISITITALNGNFYFADSTLTAEVSQQEVQINRISEPAAFLLLVTGLAGMGWMRRRRRSM